MSNHLISDFSVFNESFDLFNKLGHRDKQVVRQSIQTFSTVVSLVRARGEKARVLETGAGLSTYIFSKLLSMPGESISTIDARPVEAIDYNTRSLFSNVSIVELANCSLISGVTITHSELNTFYRLGGALIGLAEKDLLEYFDYFYNIDLDDRKYKLLQDTLGEHFIGQADVKQYLLREGLFANDLLMAYRNSDDEFVFLKEIDSAPVLENALKETRPNIVYLDSGEFSSNIEFNIISENSDSGTVLVVQDIFFPKSIKSCFIGAALLASPMWRVLWIDKTTPQGIIIALKV